MRRSGYTLTLFRKEPDGRWVLFRDANMVIAETLENYVSTAKRVKIEV